MDIMQTVSGYVRTITVFMIFMALVEIAAPSGSYKKFIRLVLSLILIALFLEPAAAAFKGVSLEGNYFRLLKTMDDALVAGERDGYEKEQAEIVISEYKKGLDERTMERLKAQTGLDVGDVSVVVNSDYESESFGEVLGIHVTVSVPAADEPDAFKKALLGNAETQNDLKTDAVLKIKNCLTDFYNVPEDNIHITVRDV